MNSTKLLLTLLSSAFLFSCVENKTPEKVDVNPDENEGLIRVEGKIFSIPSPVQTAILLRKANVKFNEDLLLPTSKASGYSTSFKRAVNLGIYGSNLAYLTNFGNAEKSAVYLKTVDDLSNQLGISSALDSKLMKRFYDNINNRDSLYALNSEFFRAANAYLRDVNQEEQAALILTGGWLEALHLSLDAAEADNNMKRRIGEQKPALQSLIDLLGEYESNQDIANLKNELSSLNSLFDGIRSEYTYVKPIVDVDNRTTHIRSKSLTEVTDEQLQSMKAKVKEIREKLTA
jgi:hypothetical protein